MSPFVRQAVARGLLRPRADPSLRPAGYAVAWPQARSDPREGDAVVGAALGRKHQFPGRAFGVQVTLLRIPGIYAGDREGGHPRERLARGAPVLVADEDVYTNHIHADDLARACVAALHRGLPQRVLHVCDDTQMKMGDYFDLAADLCALPRPPRISREQASAQMSAMQLSFMGESRRLQNGRLKHELRLRLRYPTVELGLLA